MGTPGRQPGLGAANPLLNHPVDLIGRDHAARENVRLAAVERDGDLIERGARLFFHDGHHMGSATRCRQLGKSLPIVSAAA